MSDTQENKTFCPQCGWNVEVDEDGCCVSCGCVAAGDAVGRTARLLAMEAKDADVAQTRVVELEAALARKDEEIARLEAENFDARRLLATRVEANRLSEANEEITRLKRQLWLTDCEEWDGTLHCDPARPCKACELRAKVARLERGIEARDRNRNFIDQDDIDRCAYCGAPIAIGCNSDCPTVLFPLEVSR